MHLEGRVAAVYFLANPSLMVAIFRSSKKVAEGGGHGRPFNRWPLLNFLASLLPNPRREFSSKPKGLRSCQQREVVWKSWETHGTPPFQIMIFPITIAKKGGVPQFQTNPDRIKWVKYGEISSMHISIIWPKNVWYVHMIGILTTIPNIASPQSPSNQLIHHIYLININIITIESILQHEFEVQKSSPSARFGALQSYQGGVFGKSERINR